MFGDFSFYVNLRLSVCVYSVHTYKIDMFVGATSCELQMSNEETLVGLVFQEIILSSYIGIIINHSKDPY